MMEQPASINDAADYPIEFQCGCRVVFLGSCFHRSSRMDACIEHSARDGFDERTKIVNEAKRKLRWAKAMQPPR